MIFKANSSGGITVALDASYYMGQGARSGVEREFVVIGGGSQRTSTYNPTIGALCQDDYKGINAQYVSQGKVVVLRV